MPRHDDVTRCELCGSKLADDMHTDRFRLPREFCMSAPRLTLCLSTSNACDYEWGRLVYLCEERWRPD